MSVRIEKDGPVWTVIHSRPEARNAMDPESAKALFEAFQSFDADETASVAVFWGEGGAFCAGWDLKHAASLLVPKRLIRLTFRMRVSHRWRPWGPAGWNSANP